MLALFRDCPDLLKNIIQSGEAVFHIGELVNRHNCYYWVGEDPCVISEKMQNQPKIMHWCGIILNRIVGPFILHDTMNAKRYLTMLT